MNRVSSLLVLSVICAICSCSTIPTKVISFEDIQSDIQLSRAAIAAYIQNNEERKNILQQGNLTELDFFGFDSIAVSATSSEFLIARTSNNNLIISFAGTNKPNDWEKTKEVKKKPYLDIPYGLHAGYLDSWLQVRELIVAKIHEYYQPEDRIYITGHSKGGSVSVVAGYDLLTLGFNVEKIVTFGSPPILQNLLPPGKSPAQLKEEINSHAGMAKLSTISTHYLRETDMVQEISQWWFQSSHNPGTQRLVKDTGYVETTFFSSPPYKEYIGYDDPFGANSGTDILGHDKEAYSQLLIDASDTQYGSY